jgi:hypothetical protein
MTTTLGHVARVESGVRQGALRTFNFRGDIDGSSTRDKALAAHPDDRVTCGGVEIGAWRRKVQPRARPTPPAPGPSRPWPRAYKVRSGPRPRPGRRERLRPDLEP